MTDRAELNDALTYMMSELSALHTAVQPGDVRLAPDEEIAPPASLGARLTRDEARGGWRIEHIYEGDPDYPDKLSPLSRPGLRIAVGDIIESINGTATLAAPDPEALLRHQAGRQILLRVAPAAGGAAFEAIVTPLNSTDASALRYTDWEQTRRHRVDEAGDHRIGYVHLRAMGSPDYAQWARDFYPVAHRPALILDLRHNRGGNIDSWIMSRLMRKAWMWWAPRFGEERPHALRPRELPDHVTREPRRHRGARRSSHPKSRAGGRASLAPSRGKSTAVRHDRWRAASGFRSARSNHPVSPAARQIRDRSRELFALTPRAARHPAATLTQPNPTP